MGVAAHTAANLHTAAEELSALVGARSADASKRMAAMQGAKVEAAAGRRFVRLLGVVIRSALESDDAMLAEWKKLVRLTSPESSAEPLRVGDAQPQAVQEGGATEMKASSSGLLSRRRAGGAGGGAG